MAKPINVEYNGESLNLNEWSRKLGIGYQTLVSRYKRHSNNLDKVFGKKESFLYKGEDLSILEICKKKNVLYPSVKYQIDKRRKADIEITLELVLKTIQGISSFKKYTYAGKTYNLHRWAKEFNVNYLTLRHHIVYLKESLNDFVKDKGIIFPKSKKKK